MLDRPFCDLAIPAGRPDRLASRFNAIPAARRWAWRHSPPGEAGGWAAWGSARAGGLVATVTEAFARMNLLGQLVTWNVDWGQWPVAWSVSWPVAWIGLGLIIFARVTRIGAGMRADLEGTV